MGYCLGVDLGTTFVAAAVARDDRVEMVSLGDRSVVMPAAVYVRQDGTLITGDAADRRAVSNPARVASEIKRRLGDPTPVMLGGSAFPVEELLGTLLRDVLARVVTEQGGPPDLVVLTHPANWGPYRRELFEDVPRVAGVEEWRTVTEPEAAAAYYADTRNMAEGETIAVYDLGGGTFDATVLRRTVDGIEVLGTPEGVEHLGGADLDEAVLSFVNHAAGGALSELDLGDARTTVALARLRQDCVLAKEALSLDTETVIPMFLPGRHLDVELRRDQFESLIRAQIESTVGTLGRALRSAQIQSAQLSTVLLVGGSSQIPLVARMVEEQLGCRTAVDPHPKHAVALGAATVARTELAGPGVVGRPAAATAARRGETANGNAPNGRADGAGRTPAVPAAVNGTAHAAGASHGPAAAPLGTPAVLGAAGAVPADTRPAPAGSRGPAAELAGIPQPWPGGPAGAGGRTAGAEQHAAPDVGNGPHASSGTVDDGRPWGSPSGTGPSGPQVEGLKGPGGPAGAGAPPPPPDLRASGRKLGRGPLTLIGVVALLVVAAVVLWLWQPRAGPDTPNATPAAPSSTAPTLQSVSPAPSNRPATAMPVPSLGTPIPLDVAPNFVVASPTGHQLFVASSAAGNLTVIDTAVNQVTARIPITAGPPHYLSFSPDGKRLYVSVFNDEKTIAALTIVDATNNQVVTTVPMASRPYLAAVSRDGSRVYVPNHDTGNVTVVNGVTGDKVADIKVPPNPHWVSFTPDEKRLYVADHESNVVSVIDTTTNKVVDQVSVGTSPHSVAVHPTRPLSANVNYDSASVSFIDTGTDKVVATTGVENHPQAIAWSADGRMAYSVNEGANSVSVIDAGSFGVTARIPTGESPTSIAVLPDGKTAYVSDLDGKALTVLNVGS